MQQPEGGKRPNILLVVSDQERQRDWLPATVELPWRERLLAEGMEFTNYWTHSSPCSPSRATMMTGRYVTQHQVAENVIFPWQPELDPSVTTIGGALRQAGYRSSYIGKWHLSRSARPDMEAYGYGDWDGNDHHFMGLAGTGVHFDPVIANNAAHWLRRNAQADEPWFLTVALVNPHDVMWYPVDQPEYQRAHPRTMEFIRQFLDGDWGGGQAIPPYEQPYDEVFSELPANFDDDLHTKPDTQRQWRHDQQHSLYGRIDPADKGAWLRQLDYYAQLHRLADESLGKVLGALEESGGWDDTIVIFTSDHGDMCGGHGLRSKGPFVYDEIMRVPCYVKAPGTTRPGTVSDSLASHVDLASTICALAGCPRPTRSAEWTSRPCSGTRGHPCATTCCSRTRPRTPAASSGRGTRYAACSTAGSSTPATSASAADSPPTWARSRSLRRCSTARTPTSTTTTTSCTTSRRIRASW